MKTIDEIKEIIRSDYNYGELLKDTILQKFGENKLVSCKGYNSHELGDAEGYINAAVVVNGILFVYISIKYGGEDLGFLFGSLETNNDLLNRENVYASQSSLKCFTNAIVENNCVLEYDFCNELDENKRKNKCFHFIASIWLQNYYYNKIKEIISNGKGRIICD